MRRFEVNDAGSLLSTTMKRKSVDIMTGNFTEFTTKKKSFRVQQNAKYFTSAWSWFEVEHINTNRFYWITKMLRIFTELTYDMLVDASSFGREPRENGPMKTDRGLSDHFIISDGRFSPVPNRDGWEMLTILKVKL